MPHEPDVSRESRSAEERTPRWVKVIGGLFIVLVLVVIVVHLMGRGMGGHG